MSPVGGVGINLAVQDAVGTATLLAAPLRRGRPRPAELARVHRRRIVATRMVQGLQRLLHRGIITPVLESRRADPPRALLAVLRAVPAVSTVPAYLIGYGFRPEHAPAFARRPAMPVPAPTAGVPSGG
jgi:2-polyprenyl-6-methoxyphenol hydroxylase-like FAD-dependent oxidoreductase